jgi:hypothetical protein
MAFRPPSTPVSRPAATSLTTHLVLAALIDEGLLTATDPEADRALARIEAEITRLLNGLRAL